MRKLLLTLFAVLSASFATAGDGTKANPMTVADVLAATMDDSQVYVQGYIVGSCTGTAFSTAEFGASDNSSASNILLADSPNETSGDNAIAAQLPTAVRSGLSLKNKPENLGKRVVVKALLQRYFGKNGIKSISEYEFEGEQTVDITNTPETAYTVSQARQLIDANEGLFANVYVKGLISAISEVSLANGNATYDIMDVTGLSLTVFRGKFLEGKNFTNEEQIQDGDEVIVYGQLQLYTKDGNSTYEIGQGNYLYSVNGQTTAEEEEPNPEPEPDPTPDPAVDGTELLTNGSFEEWSNGYPVNWLSTNSASTKNATQQSTEARTGGYAVEIATGSANSRLASKELKLKAGTYLYTVYVKGNGGEAIANLGFAAPKEDGNLNYIYGNGSKNQTVGGNEWTKLSQEFALSETTTVNLLVMRQKNSTNPLLIDDASLTTSDGGLEEGDDEPTPNPEPDPTVDIANTPETAYTVSQAIELIDAGQGLNKEVYVQGGVTIVNEVSVSYGNATYVISDGEKELTIFRGKYLEGKNFTDYDQIQDGDEVIVYGKLQLYTDSQTGESTYEMGNGNYLYSLNGQTQAEEEPVNTISVIEAQTLPANSTATINATVYAICKNGAVFGDETGFIYYYNTAISNLTIGDQVKVEGAVSAYGGFNQFTKTATIEKTGTTTITYPETAEIDLDTWAVQPVIQYVKVTGTLNISGNYYNLVVDGQTVQGSIIGAQDDLFGNVTNGSKITIEGFAMYTTSNGKYVNIVATKVSVDETIELQDISNTPEQPWSIADAVRFIDNPNEYDLSKQVYIKGIISEIVSLDVEKYKRAQYDIVDEVGSDVKLRVYNGYFLEGKAFTSNDQIKEGDKVVVYGQLSKYLDNYEIGQGNYIYSLNGETTDGISNVKVEKSGVIYDLSGRRVEKAQKGIYIVNGKKFVK